MVTWEQYNVWFIWYDIVGGTVPDMDYGNHNITLSVCMDTLKDIDLKKKSVFIPFVFPWYSWSP